MENSVFQKEVESHIVLGYKCNHNCMHCVVKIKRIYSEEKTQKIYPRMKLWLRLKLL